MRLLLVEDDEAVRQVARRYLLDLGYAVHEAATPSEARELFDRHGDRIAMLITDVIMPEESGEAL